MTNGTKPKISKVIFEKLEEVPIEQIYVSLMNSRQTDKDIGLTELEGSIDRIGLLQPIVVIQRGDKFECIAGQRRLNAMKAARMKNIPALVVGDMDDIMKAIVSFGENVQRYEIAYSDRVDAVSKLFKAYTGSKEEKVRQISADLGLSKSDVVDYVAEELVPKSLQKMVDDGKITRQKAHDITATFWPDEKDMLTIANQMGGLTAAQFKRALEIKRKKPKEKIEKIIEEAQKPPLLVTFKVTFTRDEADMLEAEADRRSRKINKKVTVTDLIHDAVRRFFIPAS